MVCSKLALSRANVAIYEAAWQGLLRLKMENELALKVLVEIQLLFVGSGLGNYTYTPNFTLLHKGDCIIGPVWNKVKMYH
jgi:hypothetical protein